MKSKWLVWIVAMGLVFAVPAVVVAQGFYVGLSAGPAFGEDVAIAGGNRGPVDRKHSGEVGIGAAAGYGFTFPVRLEGEFTYVRKTLDQDLAPDGDGRVEHFLYMANVYYDVIEPALGGFKPYIGAGLGFAANKERVTGQIRTDEDRFRSFAYQFKGGIAYALTRSFEMSAGYRYRHIGGDTRTSTAGRTLTFGPARVHMLEFGMAYKF